MSFSRCLIFFSRTVTSLSVISLSLVVFLSSLLAVEISFCNELISVCNCCFDLPLVFCAKAGVTINSNKANMIGSFFMLYFLMRTRSILLVIFSGKAVSSFSLTLLYLILALMSPMTKVFSSTS